MPDVFWPHFFASAGSSSDNPVLTAHFPVPAGQILCLRFMIMRRLVLGCLSELQNGQGSALKTCRSYLRRTPSNPPLDPIPGQRHIVRRHRKHMVGYRRANGVEEWSVPPVLFQPRTNLPTFTLTGIIFRRNSGFSPWHWRGILDFHRGNCVESER